MMYFSRSHVELIKKVLSESPKFQYKDSLEVLRYQESKEYVEYLVKDLGLFSALIRLREDASDLKKEYALMERLSKEGLTLEPLYLEEDASVIGSPFLMCRYEEVESFKLERDLLKLSKALGCLHALDIGELALEKKEDPLSRILTRSESIMKDLLKNQELSHEELIFFEDFIQWIKDRRLPSFKREAILCGQLDFSELKRQGGIYFWNLKDAHLDDPVVEVCEFLSPITQVLAREMVFSDKEIDDFFLLYSKDMGMDAKEEYEAFMPVMLLYQWSELMLLRSKDLDEELLVLVEHLTDLAYMRELLKNYA